MTTMAASADTCPGDNYVYYAVSKYMSKAYGRYVLYTATDMAYA